MSNQLYILQTLPQGKVIRLNLLNGESHVVVDNLDTHPDGIAVDPVRQRLYWTNMGKIIEAESLEFFQADGSLESSALDGSDHQVMISGGLFVTGKQLIFDKVNRHFYWCDREGMRVFRADENGSNLTVLVQTGIFPRDSHDYTRHCVGIAINHELGRLYWTQKGPSKGGKGRIFSIPLNMPGDQCADSRSDIRLELDHLPEPIDLEFSRDFKQLYWTDRGNDADGGNSLNVGDMINGKIVNRRILASGFKETIALAIDHDQGQVYISDLGGNIYQHTLGIQGSAKVIASGFGPLTGITLA